MGQEAAANTFKQRREIAARFERVLSELSDRGTKIDDLALRLGVEPGTVSSWKQSGCINPANLAKFCNTTGYAYQYMLLGLGEDLVANRLDKGVMPVVKTKMSIADGFSERLASAVTEVCKQKSISVTRLSLSVGKTSALISRWLDKKSIPSRPLLDKFYAFTGVSSVWLEQAQGTMFVSGSTESTTPKQVNKPIAKLPEQTVIENPDRARMNLMKLVMSLDDSEISDTIALVNKSKLLSDDHRAILNKFISCL